MFNAVKPYHPPDSVRTMTTSGAAMPIQRVPSPNSAAMEAKLVHGGPMLPQSAAKHIFYDDADKSEGPDDGSSGPWEALRVKAHCVR